MADDIVIVSAARTPVGAFNGAFANMPAHELGKVAIQAAMTRAGVEHHEILAALDHHGEVLERHVSAGPGVVEPPVGVFFDFDRFFFFGHGAHASPCPGLKHNRIPLA